MNIKEYMEWKKSLQEAVKDELKKEKKNGGTKRKRKNHNNDSQWK